MPTTIESKVSPSNLRRALWFWHFWIGLAITPFFVVVAATGMVYVFKPELELAWYRDIAASEDRQMSRYWLDPDRASEFESSAAGTVQFAGEGWNPVGIELEDGSGRLPAMLFRHESAEKGFRRIFFDPTRPGFSSGIPEPNLFTVSLSLHRRLMAGTLGRVLVELTTGWAIITGVLGLLIWWPRSWRSLRGVFVPRLRDKRYVAWRDVHAIGGAMACGLLLLIAMTGLLYSFAWGSIYHGVAFASGQYDILVDPPKSRPPGNDLESMRRLSAIDALHRARKHSIPTSRISIQIPSDREGAFVVESGHWYGPSIVSLVHIDQYSGATIQVTRLSDLGRMAQWTQWNYPLHVGSILGLPSKSLWLVASIAFVMLPVSGVVMFCLRRRPGASGFPRYQPLPTAWWFRGLLLSFGILLPLNGLVMLLLCFGIAWRSRISRRPVLE